jgi:nicotinate-nucleotide pyrophosphorylase (carboxylating)
MDAFLLDRQIQSFLAEDIGHGDITTDAIFDVNPEVTAEFIAREFLVSAGMGDVAGRVFHILNPEIVIEFALEDGQEAEAGATLLKLHGPVKDVLRGERLALNLVQRICGIATLTKKYVDQVVGLDVQITDTRKTTPGLRMLEKYAVRVGGARNHRFNLSDGVLIKDNHIAACGSIGHAVEKSRASIPHTIRIEVEAENLAQVQECLDCQADIIMLDNMSTDIMRQAVQLINGQALVEASGGVNLETVRGIAETGVDIISVGRLTHSAPSSDISMDF